MQKAVPQDQHQTVKDVADRPKVAAATVRQWIKPGQLRAIAIGKGWRMASADLNEFQRLHQTAPRQHRDRPTGLDADVKP
jgi:excisionase family DNA binding protein